MDKKITAFAKLLEIMDTLREQCPWDRKQTIHSLRNLTIEETYELADSILNEDFDEIKEELGDLMLHLVFYAKIADEQGHFDIGDAIEMLNSKLIKRHPHIYGDKTVANAEEVKKNWEQIKMDEGKKSVLSGVPNSLPALIKAYRMQDKTAQVGFEWDTKEQVWEKVMEEMDELHTAVAEETDKVKMEDEFGDVLFSLVNYARYLGIDPETALEKTNRKFKMRFQFIEENANRKLEEMTLEEMDHLWNKAKEKKI